MTSTILNEHGWEREPELIEVALAAVDKDEMRSTYNRADYDDRGRPMRGLVEQTYPGSGNLKPVCLNYQRKSR